MFELVQYYKYEKNESGKFDVIHPRGYKQETDIETEEEALRKVKSYNGNIFNEWERRSPYKLKMTG